MGGQLQSGGAERRGKESHGASAAQGRDERLARPLIYHRTRGPRVPTLGGV